MSQSNLIHTHFYAYKLHRVIMHRNKDCQNCQKGQKGAK